MTPVGLRMYEDDYSATLAQGGILSPHFAYGRAFLASMRPFAVMADLIRNIMMDKSRQMLEPPLRAKFKAMLNKYVFAPATIVQDPGGDILPLMPEIPGFSQYAFDIVKMLEGSMEKSTISPVFQGQNQPGKQTKYEVEQQLINSIRMVAGWVQCEVNRRQQRSAKILRLASKYYPQMAYGKLSEDAKLIRKFVSTSRMGDARTEVMFGEIPKSRGERLSMQAEMAKDESLSKMNGIKSKRFLVDPDDLNSCNHTIKFRVNPQQRDSSSADLEKVKDKVAMYRQSQNINQVAVDKMMIKANGDDVEELIKEQAPQMQQIQEEVPGQQPNPQTPQAPQAPEMMGPTGLGAQIPQQDALQQPPAIQSPNSPVK